LNQIIPKEIADRFPVQEIIEKVGGEVFPPTFTYDNKGRLGTRTHPSGITETNNYPRWRGFANRALLCKKTEQREQILLFFCSFIAMNKRQKIVGFYPLR
jgi:hypothetical protein